MAPRGGRGTGSDCYRVWVFFAGWGGMGVWLEKGMNELDSGDGHTTL